MNIERRDANVLFVSFGARPAAAQCEACPFRRCCSCAHWDKSTRTCGLGARAAMAPTTDEDDWCGRWAARSLELVAVDA